MITHQNRDTQLSQIIARQPYLVKLNNLTLQVDRDVFPPDLGYTSSLLASVITQYHPQIALDMGCGTGYLALVLKSHGVSQVYASDNHTRAIKCTQFNITANNLNPITTIKSNLFKDFPNIKFDFIVFNQPYFPNTGPKIFGCGKDGGLKITTKFLQGAASHLTSHGVIVMPYSDMAGVANNPKIIAHSLNYQVKTISKTSDDTQNHYIYQITLN